MSPSPLFEHNLQTNKTLWNWTKALSNWKHPHAANKKKILQFNISPPLFLLAFLCLVPSHSRSLKAGTEGVMGRGKNAIIVVYLAKNSCPNYIPEPSHHTPLPSYWSDPEIPQLFWFTILFGTGYVIYGQYLSRGKTQTKNRAAFLLSSS